MIPQLNAYYEKSYDEADLMDHYHASHELIFICEGCASFKIGTQVVLAEPNSFIFISNFESHQISIKNYPYKRYYVLIDPKHMNNLVPDPVLGSLFKHNPKKSIYKISLNKQSAQDFKCLLKDLIFEQSSESQYSSQVMSSYFLLILIKLYRLYPDLFILNTTDKNSSLIARIQSYIENECDKNITLGTLAKNNYLNASYLSHLFKKHSGYTFKQYLILQRLSLARRLLLQSDYSITLVAEKSGFGNVNHFIRMFKNAQGVSPYQYKKKYSDSSI